MRHCVYLIGLLIILLCPVPSFAELKMLVTPNGDGAFFLVGDNFNGVTAVDVRIDYDTASLADPQVAAEGGTLTYVYAGTPGTLLVSVFRENPDAAFYLDLKFQKTGASPGVIKQATVTVKDTEGKDSPVPDATIIPFSPSQDTAATAESGSAAVVSAEDKIETPRNEVYQGRPDGAPVTGADNDAASSETGAAVKPEQSAAAHETNVSEGRSLRSEKSVLRRFEEFRGTKGFKELAALFKRPDSEALAQEPAIALSDGKTAVRVTLNLQSGEQQAPDVSLSDAKLVSLRKTGEKSWIITAVPRKGAWNVSVYLKSDKKRLEFPLIVAPPIHIQNNINEKNFLAALDQYVAGQVAGQKRGNGPFAEYVHEYVFTANYLAKQARQPAQPVR
jgi:hypothetical protein